MVYLMALLERLNNLSDMTRPVPDAAAYAIPTLVSGITTHIGSASSYTEAY